MASALGNQSRNERLEQLYHIHLGGTQCGDVLRHATIADAVQPPRRNPSATEVFLQAQPRRWHLAHRREAQSEQIGYPEPWARRAADQKKRIARHNLGEADKIAAGKQLVGLHHPHRAAPADIDGAVEQPARGVA
jgi:hypothetical protein